MANETVTLSSSDDYPHHESDDPWETETWWFSFSISDQRLLGYVYVFIRPNLGTCGGGGMVWDDTAHLPWEVPYFSHQWSVPFRAGAASEPLQFPVGTSISVIEPLQRYAVLHEAGGVRVELDFEGIMAPNVFRSGRYPFTAARHLDQPGHVTGVLVLDGVEHHIDCQAMRDRSWGGPRNDQRSTRVSYAFAGVDAENAFLAFSAPEDDQAGSRERITAGYLLRGGTKAALVSGTRRTRRDPFTGWPEQIELDATDELGRELRTRGGCVNRIIFTPYPRMVNWSSLTRWNLDEGTGWGEDQDVWPLEAWRRFRAPGVVPA